MKKILLCILALSAPAFSDIAVTQGSGKTVATITDGSSREIQQVSANIDSSSNTVKVVPGSLQLLIGTTNTLNIKIADVGSVAHPIVSTNTLNVKVADIGAVAYPIVSTNTLNTSSAQSGTWNISTLTTLTNPVTVVPGASQLLVGSTNTMNVKVSDIGSVAYPIVSTNTLNVSAAQSVAANLKASVLIDGTSNQVNSFNIISTNTLPTPGASATQVEDLSDPFGRTIIQDGVATAMIKVATLTITGVTSSVLVSSAGSSTYTYLCGCVVTNTSATNTYLTFYPSGALTSSNSLVLGAPANDVPAGIWRGCAAPFFVSAANSSISTVANGSVTSLFLTCQYYQSL